MGHWPVADACAAPSPPPLPPGCRPRDGHAAVRQQQRQGAGDAGAPRAGVAWKRLLPAAAAFRLLACSCPCILLPAAACSPSRTPPTHPPPQAYAHDTAHEKIIRGLALGLALTAYGREENADALVEQMSRDQDPILRWGAMQALGLAYRGTANNAAIARLLHCAVTDVSDDVRRAAVMCLGFVLMGNPEQVRCRPQGAWGGCTGSPRAAAPRHPHWHLRQPPAAAARCFALASWLLCSCT